jgi:hypothetical protein
MVEFIEGPYSRARPEEAALWTDIASKFRAMIPVMEDEDLAACLMKVAREADPDVLKPRKGHDAELLMKSCL